MDWQIHGENVLFSTDDPGDFIISDKYATSHLSWFYMLRPNQAPFDDLRAESIPLDQNRSACELYSIVEFFLDRQIAIDS